MTEDSPTGELAELRNKLIELEFRAKSDSAFLERLQQDPQAELLAAGFNQADADRVLPQITGDISDDCGGWCDGITCIATGCCFLTAGGLPPHPV